MACFVVSASVGLGVEVVRNIVKHHEVKTSLAPNKDEITKFTFKSKLGNKLAYLELGLFFISFLSFIEHIIHGEISPYFPFITAFNDPSKLNIMWKEIATEGVIMCLSIITCWVIGVFIYDLVRTKKYQKSIRLKK